MNESDEKLRIENYTQALLEIDKFLPENINKVPGNYFRALLQNCGRELAHADYKFQFAIGAGGQAFILNCIWLKHNIPVAVKVARSRVLERDAYFKKKKRDKKNKEYENPFIGGKLETELSIRFKRGIEVQRDLASLRNHPSISASEYGYIPQVYEWNREPKLFYVMEYIEGEKLISWCQKASDKDIVRMFWKICKFTEFIHGRGIVHSDLKTENFLVATESERPIFLDFNSCRNLNSPISATSVGSLEGSVPYMSPFQLTEFANRDFRSDIWTLGITFHEMINREIYKSSLSAEDVLKIPTWQRHNPDWIQDKKLREIFVRCTTADDSQFMDISEVIRELDKVINRYTGKMQARKLAQPRYRYKVKKRWVEEYTQNKALVDVIYQVLKILEITNE